MHILGRYSLLINGREAKNGVDINTTGKLTVQLVNRSSTPRVAMFDLLGAEHNFALKWVEIPGNSYLQQEISLAGETDVVLTIRMYRDPWGMDFSTEEPKIERDPLAGMQPSEVIILKEEEHDRYPLVDPVTGEDVAEMQYIIRIKVVRGTSALH